MAGLVALAAALLVACGQQRPVTPAGASRPTATPREVAERPLPTPETRSALLPTPLATVSPSIRITKVAEGLFLPANLTFLPDGRLLFAEVQKGELRVMDAKGQLDPEPWARITDIANFKEQGILGLTIDPDFTTNRYVYAFYTKVDGDKGVARDNRIIRFTERNGRGTDMTKIKDDLPSGKCCHNGGRIAFGPDKKLYVTIGDQNDSSAAQKPGRLYGKILRLNADGSTPSDNPFARASDYRPEIFALGFRNPWGLAFHPATGVMYVTENGEVGDDEVNRVVAGGNYGNGEVDGMARDPRFVDPLYDSGVARLGPTGAAFYTGSAMAEYKNDFFFCAFNTGDLTRIKLGGADLDRVDVMEVVAKDDCRIDVANAPDGSLYFSSITGIFRFGR
ncbi:MAG: PQQ-dependent sugar dehydrogenase [Chloroflexota bacterium]